MFYVNWFRRNADGGFLWPGYGENSRVMKWIVQRLQGTVGAAETPLGLVPKPGDLDVTGLDITAQALQAAFAVNSDEWAEELPRIREWFDLLGRALPDGLNAELAELNRRLREAHQLNFDAPIAVNLP